MTDFLRSILVVKAGVALRIIAGRGAARGCIQLSALALLPVWGTDEFGRYAAAVGTFSWLVLLVMGAEKVALTVLPRTRILTRQLTRMLIGRAVTPLAVTLPLAFLGVPAGLSGSVNLYSAAAAFAAGQGLLSILAAVHRLNGRPERDGAAFAALAVWVVAMSGLAVAGVLRPHGYLLALTGSVLVDCAVLAALIPALRRRPGRSRPALGGVLDRRIVLLGGSDVADNASAAVLYVVLAATAPPAASAVLFVALLVSSLLGGLGTLILRLYQPVTSLRLRGTGGPAGRRLARRLTGWAAAGTGGTLAVAIPLVSTVDLRSSPLAIGTAVALEMAAFAAVTYAVYLLENTTGAVLALTSTAALAGLVVTAGTALAAAPSLHALGALLALNAGLAAKAGLLHVRLRHAEPVPSPQVVPI